MLIFSLSFLNPPPRLDFVFSTCKNLSIMFNSPQREFFDASRGGYPVELFGPGQVDDLICTACHSVCRNALSSSCCAGVSCQQCHNKWSENQKSASCMSCNTPKVVTHVNKFVDRMIRNLVIRCPLGCDAQGLTIGLDENVVTKHFLDSCPLYLIECKRGCGVDYLRDQEEQHVARDCRLPCPNACAEFKEEAGLPTQWIDRVTVGWVIDVCDKDNAWWPALVLSAGCDYISVQFVGFGEMFNETVNRTESKVAMLYTKMSPRVITDPYTRLPKERSQWFPDNSLPVYYSDDPEKTILKHTRPRRCWLISTTTAPTCKVAALVAMRK